MVEEFVFSHALRISEKELLRGARLAAVATNDACTAGLCGDSRPLETLERSSSLTPALHGALLEEIESARSAGDEKVHGMLAELDAERSRLLDEPVMLTHTLLLIGATRDYFPRDATRRHVLNIGSHLSVCGAAEDKLWSIDTQGSLLEGHGCSVLTTVSIGSEGSSEARMGSRPHTYVFEAAVDAEMILAEGACDDLLQFQLADIGGRTDGDVFWSRAQEACLW
jgi:hypothetical protein